MREIEFRLISVTGKIVGYEKWYIGSLDSKNFWTANTCWLYSKDGKYWNSKSIAHRYKDQFVGFKDNKRTKEYPEGQKIYEGDRVEFQGSESDKAICKVEFFEGRFVFRINENSYKDIMGWQNTKIIENIHENPELLEENNE